MATMLRGAAGMVLGLGIAGVAWAAPAANLDLYSSFQEEAAVLAAEHDVEWDSSVQLVSDCAASSDCGDGCDLDCGAGLGCAGLGCGDVVDFGNTCCCGPTWYASAGAIFLKRERPDAGTVVAANPAGTRFSSASDFSFDWDPGVDVGLARRLGGGNFLEARYFGVDSTDYNTFVTPGNFIGAGFTGPTGTNFNGKYLSMLDSTELNVRHAVNDRLSILAGFRWVELKDEMFYKLNGNVATGDYEYNNRLYGGQLGASYTPTKPGGRWITNAEAKIGVYGNDADGGIFEFQGNNPIGSFTDNDTTTSFVGEIDLTLGYRLTKHLTLRGGYQLLWLDQVALAGNAASRSLVNPSLLRDIDYNSLFYQGAVTGIDFVW